MTVIPKIKGTCENCLSPIFDIACGTDCEKEAIEWLRMAGACGCTCKEMNWQACAEFETVDNCPCIDGTTATGTIITRIWIGCGDPSENLITIAHLNCDGQTSARLFGSTSPINCLSDTSTMSPLIWGGATEQLNIVPTALVHVGDQCTGGLFSVDAGDFNLTLDPPETEDGVSCTQSGGYPYLAVEINDACGNHLCICPFAGLVGGKFNCGEPLNFCCLLGLDEEVIPCDGDSGFINYTYTWTAGCACYPDATITIDATDYTLTNPPTPISHEVTPCTLGVTTVTVTLTLVYPAAGDGCDFDCTEHNTVSSHDVTV